MIGGCAKPLDGLIPQAGAQPLTQLRPGLRLLRPRVEQRLILWHKGWQVFGNQPQVAHRCGYAQRLKAPTGQLEQHRSIAFGRQQTHLEQGIRPLGVLQMQAEALHATVSPGQKCSKVVEHAPQREQQRLVRFDVEVEFQPGFETVGWLVEVQPQVAQAEQLVEVQLHLGRKAPGQGIAGQGQYLAQLVQAHAGKRFSRLCR